MRQPRPARVRRWQATLITTLVLVAVAAAAGVGWWYARESPPHQGPIVLISVDGISASELPAYGAQRTDTPAIDTLAAEAVVFERAYTHSTQTLPAHASILSGRLPVDHGVRDDAGFVLSPEVRTLPELLRSRGFNTGAAVSTFLLRPESGIAQGFMFFDGELPATAPIEAPAIEREGTLTVEAAEQWMEQQDDQRFFLFVQVDEGHADAAVARLRQRLAQHDLYDRATIVLVGDRGETGNGMSLDDAALRIPLLVKQPDGEGAGRRVADPVQHIDLLPTILDLVRAPLPDGLEGQSLREVLDGDEAGIPVRPIYAESLSAYYRFGGDPVAAVTEGSYRYVRGTTEELIALLPPSDDSSGGESERAGRLRIALDRIVDGTALHRVRPLSAGDEERFALFGYLPTLRGPAEDIPADAGTQRAIEEAHRLAAQLIGQKKYSAGIRALQAIVGEHGTLAPVHYQIGTLLVRTGRLDEGIAAFQRAQELRPEAADVALALADALLRADQTAAAQQQVDMAVARLGTTTGPRAADARASSIDPADRAAAYEMAARVALARKDAQAALAHAEAAQRALPTRPVTAFVRGRLAYDEARYDDAAAAFEEAEAVVRDGGEPLADLHLYHGETLSRLDRYADAEAQFREELSAFPRNIQAYTSLAMLYRASNRDGAVEDVLNELVAATPTPEGYAVAARLWTILGDRSRAEALRSDARARFRGDPSLALLGRDTRR